MSKAKINDPEFAERLQWILREKFNGNAREFSRSIGIAITSLNRWLIGEADPSRSNLIKTAKASGVDLEWLATGKGHQYNKTEETTSSYQPYSGEDAIVISQKRLEAAIETLEEALHRTGKVMKPKGKVGAILALYELLTDEEPNQKQAQVQTLLINTLELVA